MNQRIGHIAALAVAVTLSAAAHAQDPGTAFMYQGRLTSSGATANGLHDLRFTLWTNPSDPNDQIGPVVCKDGVLIEDGLFSVQIDFGQNVLTGFPLWLGIEVRADSTPSNCGVGGGFTTLSPRQPLTPTPYAVFATNAKSAGLRLPFDGESTVSPLLDLENTTGTSATTYTGIFRVRSTGANSRALTGIASGDTGLTYGVYGQSTSIAGIGVQGESFGIAGVRGMATNIGGRGVFGEATTTSGVNYGVYGLSESTSGRGVVGIATASNGTNYGVYGVTSSSSGYAGYFLGGRNYFSGAVGIGTVNPVSPLHVMSDTTSLESVYVSNAGAGRAAFFESQGSGGSAAVVCYKNNGAALQVLGTFTAAGVVATDVPLAIAGGSDSNLSGGGYLVCGSTSAANLSIDNNEIMARSSGGASALFFNQDGGDVVVSGAGSGKLGLGTNTPQQRLDVAGNVHLTGGIYFGTGVVNPIGHSDNVLSFGDPGVGEDHLVYADGAFVFQDSPGGGDTSNPNILAKDFISNSDIRLKKDVEPLRGALDKVLRIQGLRYRFDGAKVDPAGDLTNEDENLHLGFSAQDLEQVVPEAVEYFPTMDQYGVSYGALVPVLVEAIKEQQTQIDTLQKQLDAIQQRLDALEQRR